MQAFDLGINAAARGGQTTCRTRRKQGGHRSLLAVNEDARACLQRSHVRWLDAPDQNGILKPGGSCMPAVTPDILS